MKLNIKWTLALGCFTAMALSSCLKDKDYDNGLIQSTANANIQVISFGLNVASTTNFATQSYDNSNTDTTVELIPVELGGPNAAKQDIHVSIALDDQLIQNYNDSFGTDFIRPTAVQLDTFATIAKGQRIGYVKATFVPSAIIGTDYAFGVKITGVKESGYQIAQNLDTGVVAIVIKNIYDGTYTANGYFFHPSNSSLIGLFSDKTTTLASTGQYSVQLSSGQPSVGGFLGAYPIFTVDPATNLVTVSGSVGASAITGPADNTFVNRYDPATKTFYVSYTYNGRKAWDTLVYSGPR